MKIDRFISIGFVTMMKKIVLLSALSLYSCYASAIGVALSSGDGVVGIRPYRMALLWDLGPWFKAEEKYHYHGYWELSAAHWNGRAGRYVNSRENLSLFTTGPQIRWQRSVAGKRDNIPYIEAGIGLSWLSQREIGGRRLSMHFQFEDRLGVGLLFGPEQVWDINYRLFHYSNASLGKYNSGVNMHMLTIGHWF